MSYRPDTVANGGQRLTEFQALHATQVGYTGTIVIEIDVGRWLTVNLWDTQADATAALPIMVPAVRRLLEPMMDGPSTLIGAGAVVLTDLSRC